MTAKQVAIVVGGSRGIGRQIAIDLAKNGYNGRSVTSYRDHETKINSYSRCSGQNDIRCLQMLPLPAGSK